MLLQFRGGTESVTLYIDRKNKKLEVSSSKTNYVKESVEWKNLFDKGKEKYQEKITDELDDNMFIRAVAMDMAKVGYRLEVVKC